MTTRCEQRRFQLSMRVWHALEGSRSTAGGLPAVESSILGSPAARVMNRLTTSLDQRTPRAVRQEASVWRRIARSSGYTLASALCLGVGLTLDLNAHTEVTCLILGAALAIVTVLIFLYD